MIERTNITYSPSVLQEHIVEEKTKEPALLAKKKKEKKKKKGP